MQPRDLHVGQPRRARCSQLALIALLLLAGLLLLDRSYVLSPRPPPNDNDDDDAKDALKELKEAGGLIIDQDFDKVLPKLGMFGAAIGEALKRLGGAMGTATKDEATKEKFREATLSGTKVADSFAVFVKAASQQALPPGEQ